MNEIGTKLLVFKDDVYSLAGKFKNDFLKCDVLLTKTMDVAIL